MAIQFACSCGRKLQSQDEHAGREVRCPECGALQTVPAADNAVQAEEPAKPGPVQATKPRRAEVVDEERDEDRPRRRPDDDQDEERRPRRFSREDDEDDDPRIRRPAGMSGKAVAALVLGLLSLLMFCLSGIPAIILGFMSLGDVRRSGGRLGGSGLAIAGLVLGSLSLVTTPVLVLIPAVLNVRNSAARLASQNNLKQMSLAMLNDADTNQGRMTAPAIYDKNGKPLLSWRVAILPYVEQVGLYQQFNLDESWDSPHNSRLIPLMPKVYAHPSDPTANAEGRTHYRVFTGPQTPFPDQAPTGGGNRSQMRIPGSFLDGMSNTILVVEATDAVTWTKPDELPYNPVKPLPSLGLDPKKGFNAAMGDGSVRLILPTVSEQTKRAAITPAGNDFLGQDW